MRKKLRLESLAVDSFFTGAADGGRGTVHARATVTAPPQQVGCTCQQTCLCPSQAYYCATIMATGYSCDYTLNASCAYASAGCDTRGYGASAPLCPG